ncbi:glycosyltransferase family 2 protein [Wenyingzhuangia sp. 2_MG-2023]|uniref:glycosyltransferase family 2 protein n=1 Tax=Wenyingzhuangia sp. 2_MG-2023 TaxID=3062639 RepID=UPI0026E35496|nr:glycosyltransferase family 2 protein [Wenyingzhuangia sp. 2_MG-2023]MDO6739317.1 glycosyltransferase family 2 protein [Wenyingzhuangia sp. 2_MG-2023]
MKKTTITAVILTYNEEQHIERCIQSLKHTVEQVVVVDSYSSDNTVKIAKRLGAKVYQNSWVNYATQFNWALENCNIQSDWVWRIDADEYIENSSMDLSSELSNLDKDISGIYVKRKIVFMGRELLYGGWYPVWHLKIWKLGKGTCENRWMDEHIKLSDGEVLKMDIVQVDENLNDLSWWTTKHNSYATREMIDLLDTKYNIFSKSELQPKLFGSSEQRKRYLKSRYLNLPLFVRPVMYFFYRYIFKLGFLDGKSGLVWHVLQGFWYRFLVDAKIYELNRTFGGDKGKIREYIRHKYSVK